MTDQTATLGETAPPRQRRSWRRGDLRSRPFPMPSAIDRHHPGPALDALREWAEGQAADAVEWYLKDKRIKRIGARLLRSVAILLATAGGVAPLVSAATGGAPGWGYVLLALAAGCVAFDHFFGMSAGWKRDMGTVHALQRRIAQFNFEWMAAEAARAGTMDLGPGAVQERIALIQGFAEDTADLVRSETAEWRTDLSASTAHLGGQNGWSWPSGPAGANG